MPKQDSSQAERQPPAVKPHLAPLGVGPKAINVAHQHMLEKELAVSPSARMLQSAAHNENLLVCGANEKGQLGLERFGEPVATPEAIQGPVKWVAVALGHTHGAAVDDRRQLYSWGEFRAMAEPQVPPPPPPPPGLIFPLSFLIVGSGGPPLPIYSHGGGLAKLAERLHTNMDGWMDGWTGIPSHVMAEVQLDFVSRHLHSVPTPAAHTALG